HRAINIISKRDTIKKGEVFQGQIHVFGPNLENVEIMISLAPYGVFKEKLKYIKIPVKNGIANYTLKPDKIGNYFIDVTVVDDRLPAYIEEKTRDVFVINK
ncbi:MAG: hypothetical protein L6Q66_06425, partial [Bacteroidia bacterium]|nr:hypothetical protein [Bacteroidia bacterium]